MSLSPYLAAYYASLTPANANYNFAAYSNPSAAPDGWPSHSGAVSRVAGQVSAYAVQITASPSAFGGIEEFPVPAFAGPGWYVIEAVLTLDSGALQWCQIPLNTYTDTTCSTFVEQVSLNPDTDPDVGGVVHGVGVPGQTYVYKKLVQVKSPLSQAALFFAMSHSNSVGPTGTDVITFHLAGFRPATIGEIAAGNQVQALPVFPLLPGVTPDVEKAPHWSTKVKRASSGLERRTAQWPYPIWNFSLRYEVLRDRALLDEVKGIWELFNTVQGQFAPWLFLDQGDYAVTGATFGVGDGATTSFQLMRNLRSWSEPVLAPFGVTTYVGGSATMSLLGSSGVVTFASPPAAGTVLTWSGYFFYVCRFAQDDLTLKRIAHQLWSNDGLKFNSVRAL